MIRTDRSGGLIAVTTMLAVSVLLGACTGTTSTPNDRRPDDSAASSSTSPDTTTSRQPASNQSALQVPSTLPDGNFPSVLDPNRDGSLKDVRVRLITVAEADAPTVLAERPGHRGQFFVAERAGRVRLATRAPGSRQLTVAKTALVDISKDVATDGETGLLGLAFSPDGNTVYLSYNVANHDSRVDAARVTGSDDTTKIGSRTKLFEVDQMGTSFHKGGNLVVDGDGLLYAGFGDGGPQNDENRHAQNPNLLLGKILRIDPEHSTASEPYAIPDGNPYATGVDGRPEIWLSGLRNPWRFSIDSTTGDIWIGDVGQNEIEEVDRLPGGRIADAANLGWSGFEGTRVFEKGRVSGASVPPIFELSHDEGVCSITGGVVYRGKAIRALDGVYLYSDLCRSGVFGIRAETPRDGIGRVTDERLIDGTAQGAQIISFATDSNGEVFTLSMDGRIHMLVPAG